MRCGSGGTPAGSLVDGKVLDVSAVGSALRQLLARTEIEETRALVAASERSLEARVVYGNYEPVRDTFFEKCATLAYVTPKTDRPGGRMRGPSIASCLLRRDA